MLLAARLHIVASRSTRSELILIILGDLHSLSKQLESYYRGGGAGGAGGTVAPPPIIKVGGALPPKLAGSVYRLFLIGLTQSTHDKSLRQSRL